LKMASAGPGQAGREPVSSQDYCLAKLWKELVELPAIEPATS